jgi:hypothetical protein
MQLERWRVPRLAYHQWTGVRGCLRRAALAGTLWIWRPHPGQPLSGDTVRMAIVAVPDGIPRVEVPVPESTRWRRFLLRVPLVVDAQDDHGVRSVVIGVAASAGWDLPIRPRPDHPAPRADQQRAIVGFELDLNQRGLLPGTPSVISSRPTTLGPNQAHSKEFVLRLPLSEVRQRPGRPPSPSRDGWTVAAASRQLERATEDLSGTPPQPG